MQEFYLKYKNTVDKAIFFGLIFLTVVVFFRYLLVYTAPFFVGMIISLIMEPLIRLLAKGARFPRWAAALVCLLLFIVAMGSLGTLIVSTISKQVASFMENAPALINEVVRTLDELNEQIRGLLDMVPDTIDFEFSDIQSELISMLSSIYSGGGVWDRSLKIVSNAPEFFINVILTMVTAFFLMKDRPVILEWLKAACPTWLERNLLMLRRGLSRAVGGYFRAQFILISIVFVLGSTGLFILRNPYALLIGLIMAVLDFLPMIGTGFVLIPWSLFNLVTGNYQMAAGLLVLYGVITLARQMFEPKILGVQIGVYPLITLMSMYIGFRVFGFLGIFIGPSLVIIGKAIRETERFGEAVPVQDNIDKPVKANIITSLLKRIKKRK